MLVVHENRGLNPYIEDVARRFALANFIAYAPDGLTSVGGYPGDDEKGAAAFRQVNGPKMLEDFVAAAEMAARRYPESTGRLGVVGFCFGGGIVQSAGRAACPISALARRSTAASSSAEDAAKIKAPLLLHYAGNDQGVNAGMAGVRSGAQGQQQELRRRTSTRARQHGFHNDTTPRYDEAAAKLAWQRTLDFFNKNLRG